MFNSIHEAGREEALCTYHRVTPGYSLILAIVLTIVIVYGKYNIGHAGLTAKAIAILINTCEQGGIFAQFIMS